MAGTATTNFSGFSNSGLRSSAPDTFAEGLEKQAESTPQDDAIQQQKKVDTNNTWNTFLAPESSSASNVSITRLDSTFNNPTNLESSTKISFEEIYAQFTETKPVEVKEFEKNEAVTVEQKAASQNLEGSILFEQKAEATGESSAEKLVEKSSLKKDKVKNAGLETSKEVIQQTIKVAKFGLKGSKEVKAAVKDLLTGFIFFRDKKPDPKAKENAEKAAKRKANKSRFISLLKEGMSIYYAGVRKAMMELEVKLGTNVLRTEDKNKLLGRNRNISFEGNDSVYTIHQTAFAMVEQKKMQQQAQQPKVGPRGKPSRGQIFTDKNLSGERSGGNNMMSAVG